MAPERRHPILLAALAAAHTDIVDEMVQLFDQAISGTDSRAHHQVAERRLAAAGADTERLVLLDDILEVVLDDDLDDTAAGSAVRGVGVDRLAGAVRSDEERLPSDGGHLELGEATYSHVRSFAPQVLGALTFEASVARSEVLDAVILLQVMKADGRRHVPDDTPTGFVPARWQPYLDAASAAGDANRYKHYWELCVLFALRGGLRSGEIWVHDSRRYADPASYLITRAAWPAQRDEVLALTGMPPASPSASLASTPRPPGTSTPSKPFSAPPTARSASTTLASSTSAHSPPRTTTRRWPPNATPSSPASPPCL